MMGPDVVSGKFWPVRPCPLGSWVWWTLQKC